MCLHTRPRQRNRRSRGFGSRWLKMFRKHQTEEETDLEQGYDMRHLIQIELERTVERCGRAVKCHSPLFAIEVQNMTLTLEGYGDYVYYKGIKKIQCHEQFLDIREQIPQNTIPIGLTDIIFKFDLTPDLPPSYKKKTTSFSVDICYRLKLSLENYKIDVDSTEKSLTIIKDFQLRESRRIHLTRGVENTELRMIMCPKADGLTIEVGVSLEKRWYFPGDHVSMNIHVANNTDINIRTVHVYLLRYLTIRKKVDAPPELVKIYLDDSYFSFEIRNHSDSYTPVNLRTRPKLVTINQSKLFSLYFKLEVIVNLPGPYQRGVLEIPIQVTERRVKVLVPHCAHHNERYLDDRDF